MTSDIRKEVPTGFFGQELKEGDYIAMSCSTYQTNYVKVGKIVAIVYHKSTRYDHKTKKYEDVMVPELNVRSRNPEYSEWQYSYSTGEGRHVTKDKSWTKRVYNWKTAVTLREEDIPENYRVS